MAQQWIIDSTQGGHTGVDLMDCRIKLIEDADGLHYELNSRENVVWAVTPGPLLPETPFEFPKFKIPGGPPWQWTVTVENLDLEEGRKAVGRWSNNKPKEGPPADESGTWTAQSGGGMEGKEDVASAYA